MAPYRRISEPKIPGVASLSGGCEALRLATCSAIFHLRLRWSPLLYSAFEPDPLLKHYERDLADSRRSRES